MPALWYAISASFMDGRRKQCRALMPSQKICVLKSGFTPSFATNLAVRARNCARRKKKRLTFRISSRFLLSLIPPLESFKRGMEIH